MPEEGKDYGATGAPQGVSSEDLRGATPVSPEDPFGATGRPLTPDERTAMNTKPAEQQVVSPLPERRSALGRLADFLTGRRRTSPPETRSAASNYGDATDSGIGGSLDSGDGTGSSTT